MKPKSKQAKDLYKHRSSQSSKKIQTKSKPNKTRICSHRGCKKKLRSNSQGDTCYEHRNNKSSSMKEIERINKIGPRGGKKKSKVAKKPRQSVGNHLKKVDIVFLIIDPCHEPKPKFLTLDTVDISPYKFFNALAKMKDMGIGEKPVVMAGLVSLEVTNRYLTMDDLEAGIQAYMPEVRRFLPELAPYIKFETESQKVYKLGKQGTFVLHGAIIAPRNK